MFLGGRFLTGTFPFPSCLRFFDLRGFAVDLLCEPIGVGASVTRPAISLGFYVIRTTSFLDTNA